jgi:hypothetical protein
LNNDRSGKPQSTYFTEHPPAAFGNSTGDRQMLDYTQASGGTSDDAGSA